MVRVHVLLSLTLATRIGQADASVADLQRARTKRPRDVYQGPFDELATALNPHVRAAFPYATPCENWTISELQEFQYRILKQASPEINDVYGSTSDPRHLAAGEVTRLWAVANAEVVGSSLAIQRLQRNAHCREAIMWLVHHVSEEDKSRSFRNRPVPLLGQHLPEETHAREQSGACGKDTSAPAVCAHARASSVCGTCHVGSKNSPAPAKPPADKGADGQPLWPMPYPDSMTMLLRVYFRIPFWGKMIFDDEVVKDYRYAHGQQLFTHKEDGPSKGCKVLIENITNASNTWAWVRQPNGTTTCLKLWQDLTLLPQERVRTSGGWARRGRKQFVEPTTGDVHDSWTWCRGDKVCYYEDVNTHAPVYYNPTSIPLLGPIIVETYSNYTPTADKGPFELPPECPSRSAPPMYTDNTQKELTQLCKPLFSGAEARQYIV